MSTPPNVTASSTFGFTLNIWNTGGTPAYQPISGMKPCNVPTLEVESAIDTTTHGSPSGIATFIASGILKWDEVNGEFNVDIGGAAGANSDPGQIFLLANVGTIQKFKAVVAGVTAAAFFNALIMSAKTEPEKLAGVRACKFILKPTGVAPIS